MKFLFMLALFLQAQSFTVKIPGGATVDGMALYTQGVIQPPAVTKSDMPPSISVKMSPEEIRRLENANKALAEAEGALVKAKNLRQSAEYEIIKSHRGDNLPEADCQFQNGWTFTQNAGIGLTLAPEPTGYLAAIIGNWVIFTKGFRECHAV